MYLIQLIKKKIVPAAVCLLISSVSLAQITPATTAAPAEKDNLLATLLVITTIILAFVIWGMGQALIAISRQVMEKNRAAGKTLSTLLLIAFTMASQLVNAQAAAQEAVKDTPNYGGLSANNFYAFVGVLIIEFFAILFLTFSIRRLYRELIPAVSTAKPKTAAKWAEAWARIDQKFFTKAVAVEKEADILLDHDYDGIQELDNSLPPWWKWGFVITIVFAFVYLGIFHAFGTGKNPTQEYAAEMEKARIEKEIYEANNKDKIDENNVPMADAAGLESGKAIYEANCVACHLKDGGGNVGPNLTDDYWLHKGSLNAIYNTLKVGYPDKGMQSWAAQFTPKQLSQVASYIKTLKGTKPVMPKIAQGELYTEEAVAVTDSTIAPKKDTLVPATPSK